MTITEVGKKYGLTADTLRYYERIGLIPSVNRGRGGIRDYLEEDCRWVGFIKCMRDAGLPVEALIDYVALFQQGDSTAEARKEILREQRRLLAARLDDMRMTLEKLDYKIERYEQVLAPKERLL